jgi:hypothetical protein
MRTAEGENGLSLAMHDNLAFKRNQGTSARACAPLARLGAQPCLVPAPASAFAQGVPNVPAINGRDAALLQRGEGALAAETQQKQNSAGCEGGQLGLYTESTVDRFFLAGPLYSHG